MLAPLAARVAVGELAALAAQPEALCLVLPTALSALEHAAPADSASETSQDFQQVVMHLVNQLAHSLKP